jgi:hypothetical protein
VIADADFRLDDLANVNYYAAIQSAWAFWHNLFRPYETAFRDHLPNLKTIHFQNCNKNSPQDRYDDFDLFVQFGYLHPAQEAEMAKLNGDFAQHVGFAIRTSYDTVNLRAKGFVYLKSPAQLRQDLPFPIFYGVKQLYLNLVHELGHVMGFQHTSSLTRVMAADVPYSSLKREYPPEIWALDGGSITNKQCDLSLKEHAVAYKALSLSEDAECYKLRFKTNSMGGNFLEILPWKEELKSFGRASTFQAQELYEQRLTSNEYRIWLPPEQLVFPNYANSDFMLIPMAIHSVYKVIVNKQPVIIIKDTNTMILQTVFDGFFYTNLQLEKGFPLLD